MRTLSQYLAKAAEFDALAKTAPPGDLKTRYSDIAETYRLMATERRRLLAQGSIAPDPENNGPH